MRFTMSNDGIREWEVLILAARLQACKLQSQVPPYLCAVATVGITAMAGSPHLMEYQRLDCCTDLEIIFLGLLYHIYIYILI